VRVTNLAIAPIAFACFLGSALLGMWAHRVLPEHHVKDESKDLLKLGLGIIGTSAGLVLGLLVAGASGSYNVQRANVTEMATKLALLDRVLAHYGPGSHDARQVLRTTAISVRDQMWPANGAGNSQLRPVFAGEDVFDRIEELAPRTQEQRSVKDIALRLALDLGELRWQIYEQLTSSISIPLLVMLVFWFSVTFCGFGIVSPSNPTTVTAMALCAVSISGAIFLMLEMYSPFQGLVRISSAPIEQAVAILGR
jgi:hypothetical protein